MANRERGEAGITVGGKAYTLRPSFDAYCELEELVGGRSFEDMLQAVNRGRLSGLRAVIWCFLHDEHSDEIKTLKDASQWIEQVGAGEAMALVEKVLGLNAPEQADGGSQTHPPDAQVGTGEPSSSVLVGSV